MPKLVVPSIKPYWATRDGYTAKLYRGHVIDVLRRLPSASVHCVVTSPPYWGLRDYQSDKRYEIGSEKTPQEYVTKMVAVFREVRRVLRDDGTLWLNLGDTYNANTGKGFNHNKYRPESARETVIRSSDIVNGNLIGTPWRVALALQADGWILRQDIVWHKPSPMPESVRNRCTKAHEYIFLLAKRLGYFYDAEAIKSPAIPVERLISGKSGSLGQAIAMGRKPTGNAVPGSIIRTGNLANKRSVWTVSEDEWRQFLAWKQNRNKLDVWKVSAYGYDGAHFATYPPKLIEPCILAGTSEKGCCSRCGKPWQRIVDNRGATGGHSFNRRDGSPHERNTGLRNQASATWDIRTVDWNPACGCNAGVIPCTVLDPFVGSGTTCCVAIAHGRRSIGIDLSEDYLQYNAIPRIEGELLKRPATSVLIQRKIQRLDVGQKIS